MTPVSLRFRWLAAMCLPMAVIACSDTTPTSPDADLLMGPQLSVQGGGGLLYGSDGAGGAPSTLYTIDPGTGVATAVGPIGFDGVRGLAFAPDGTLYGLSGEGGMFSRLSLITIDAATGAGTEVGPAVGPGYLSRFDLSFRNGDGVLFASGWGANRCLAVATLDLGTGAATPAPQPTGSCAPGNGIAFSASDVLHLADIFGLYTVDAGTGAASPPVRFTYVGLPEGVVRALSFDPATDDLYAVVFREDNVSGRRSYLTTVDPATGVVTNVGQSTRELTAIAWQSDGGADVTPPTVTAEVVPVPDKSVKSKKGLFEVRFSCEDDCDPDATPTATLNEIPVENGQVVDLRLRSAKSGKGDKSNKSEKSEKSAKSGRSDKPMKITASSFELVVICVDEAGNEGVAVATPIFGEKSGKSR